MHLPMLYSLNIVIALVAVLHSGHGQVCSWVQVEPSSATYTRSVGAPATFIMNVSNEKFLDGGRLTWEGNSNDISIMRYDLAKDEFFERLPSPRGNGSSEIGSHQVSISSLKISDDGLAVSAVSGGCTSNDRSPVVTLHVKACEIPWNVKAVGQNLNITITSPSKGIYFNFTDKANCSCPVSNQPTNQPILCNVDGTRADGSATCSESAEWKGCENLQCWSGPSNIRAIQVNFTVNAKNPFNCTYSEGFPLATKTEYKLGSMVLKDNDVLKSSDNGKNFSCQVYSDFTRKHPNESAKPAVIVTTVYYSPENSSLSNNSLQIEKDSFALLNYSCSVNPEVGDVSFTIQKTKGDVKNLTWGNSYVDGTSHVYVFRFTSKEGDGEYEVCASTESPPGKDCQTFTIVLVPTDDNTDESNNSTIIIIGAVLGATLFITLLIIGGAVLYNRRAGD